MTDIDDAWFFSGISGHGDSSSKSVPTLVKSIGLVGQVACGSSHTIALSQDGASVWSFGAGDSGMYTFLTCRSFLLLCFGLEANSKLR